MSVVRRCLGWLVVSRETSWRFAIPWVVLYTAFLIWGHTIHEPWRDEIHPWIIARQADGFWDIATGDRVYDGHPPGWFWYLRVWTWLTPNLWGLHAATIAAMAGAALLFLRYAPFPRLLRVGLLFSYLLAYEYGILARNYSLGVLLLFAYGALYQRLRPRYLALSVVLGLLALTSVYGVILAGVLFLVLVADGSSLGWSRLRPGLLKLRIEPRLVAGACIVAVGVGFSYLTTTPQDPNPFAPTWNFNALNTDGLVTSAKRLVLAFWPIRSFSDVHYWWNAEYFWQAHPWVFAGAAVLLPLLLVASVARYWVELAVLLCGEALMAVLELARYPGGIRHWGHHFLVFLAVCWLARLRRPGARNSTMMLVLSASCAFQIPCLVVAAYRDGVQSFSGAEYIAKRIETEGLQRLPIVAGPDAVAISLMGRLNLPFISCETEEINQTMVFHGRRVPFSTANLLSKAVSVAQERRSAVLIASFTPMELPAPNGFVLEFLFTNVPPAADENLFVYKLSASLPAQHSALPR